MLRAHGIPAELQDGELVNMNWAYSLAIGGVKVIVPSSQANEARAYIAATQEEQFSIPVCHHCGSTEMVHVMPRGLRSLWLLLIGSSGKEDGKRLRCAKCGKWW